MARRKEEAPGVGSPLWMATFGDLMNLLLCFFVMIFAFSDPDEGKMKEISESLNASFSIWDAGITAMGESVLIGNGIAQIEGLEEYVNGIKGESEQGLDSEGNVDKPSDYDEMAALVEQTQLEQSEALAEKISEAIQEGHMGDEIAVSFTSQYVQLTLKGAILFDPGKVDLRKSAQPIVDKVGIILERYAKGIIEIEGHTDNVPMHNDKYANNNELSAARALSVFDYLIETTSLEPAIIKYSGRGEYVPIADNDTPEGKAKNRRVEIKIFNSATMSSINY